MFPNELQCILDVLHSLQNFVQGRHENEWFDRVMAMLRRLQNMRYAFNNIELEFLERQCRAVVDAKPYAWLLSFIIFKIW